MEYFAFLETRWVECQQKLAVRPEDVRIEDQARFNAVVKLIEISRKLIMWGSVITLVGSYLLIKTRIKKAPEFKSSIPPQPPTKPTLVRDVPPAA